MGVSKFFKVAAALMAVIAALSQAAPIRREGHAVHDKLVRLAKPKLNASKKVLNVPPRYIWGWLLGVSGYCGETSFQSTLLLHGAWVSSELVRYAAGNKELLIGVNDAKAAKALKMDYTQVVKYNKFDGDAFLMDTVKPAIDAGTVPVLGWFLKKKNGDADYDHIMPIVGYETNSAGTAVDVVYFNDLYLNQTRTVNRYTSTGAKNAYFLSSRSTCVTSNPKQPYDYCMPNDHVYAILLKGIAGDSLVQPATLDVGDWTEPDWGAEDNLHQKPITFQVSLTVSDLIVGRQYSVLRFNDVTAMPTSGDFFASSYTAKYDFVANATTQRLLKFAAVRSDSTAYFRVLPSP